MKFDFKTAIPYILVGFAIAVFTPIGDKVKELIKGKG